MVVICLLVNTTNKLLFPRTFCKRLGAIYSAKSCVKSNTIIKADHKYATRRKLPVQKVQAVQMQILATERTLSVILSPGLTEWLIG